MGSEEIGSARRERSGKLVIFWLKHTLDRLVINQKTLVSLALLHAFYLSQNSRKTQKHTAHGIEVGFSFCRVLLTESFGSPLTERAMVVYFWFFGFNVCD